MLRSLFYLLKLVLFWLIVFTTGRLVFIFTNLNRFNGNMSELLNGFLQSLRLDFSTIGYIITPLFILWSIQQAVKRNIINKISYIINSLQVFIVVMVTIGNALLYREWNTLINARVFMYLSSFKEVITFASIGQILIFTVGCAALFVLLLFLFHLMQLVTIPYSTKKWFVKTPVIVAVGIVLLIMVRGGWQLLPVNQSSAFYSSKPVYNHFATNCIWYLASNIVETKDKTNQFVFFENEEAKKITQALFPNKSKASLQLLNTKKPNIVFIILESWSANTVAALGGKPGITPQFDSLCKHGLLFTNAYGSGYRTDQGIVSILSGFPAQPNTSIIFDPPKSEQLPSINKVLLNNGYKASSFYYGGDMVFANMKTYLLSGGFRDLVDKQSFSGKQRNAKWGAHDEFVLAKQLEHINTMPQPFISALLTLSSHEPYEVPMQTPFNGSDEASQFCKAIYYSDKCLGDYFTQAHKQPWFKNTLFVLVADHGHRLPIDCDMSFPESKKIAFMLYGGALRDSLKGKTIDKLVNQHDIPCLLLDQLGISSANFFWSNDVFNSNYKPVIYYANENVLGWITPDQKLVYSFTSESILLNEGNKINTSVNIANAKAYLQTLFQQYLDY